MTPNILIGNIAANYLAIAPEVQQQVEDDARRQLHQLVIDTDRSGALGHLVMGSVAERVVRMAPCPVLTVRHPDTRDFARPDTLATVEQAS